MGTPCGALNGCRVVAYLSKLSELANLSIFALNWEIQASLQIGALASSSVEVASPEKKIGLPLRQSVRDRPDGAWLEIVAFA